MAARGVPQNILHFIHIHVVQPSAIPIQKFRNRIESWLATVERSRVVTVGMEDNHTPCPVLKSRFRLIVRPAIKQCALSFFVLLTKASAGGKPNQNFQILIDGP